MTDLNAPGLYVRQLHLGPMKNFVYLVGDPESPEVAVVDPAWDVPAILEAAESEHKRIVCAVVSHHHFDHINGLPKLLKKLDVPVYAQRTEIEFSEHLRHFGSAMKPMGPGDTIEVGRLPLKLIHTPGHTPGSQCLYCRGALLSGDTVFVNACGRCDLEGGDPEQMFDSLNRVLGELPSDTRLLPGHDYGDVPESTLQRERQQNPYFQDAQLATFVTHRMRPRH